MSDPAYPCGANPASAQNLYSQRAPYGPAASTPYDHPETVYRRQPAYGTSNGATYSQPTSTYAQPYYVSSHPVTYADLHSQVRLATILADVSFLTTLPLLSTPAMALSFMQRREVKCLDAPQNITSLTNTVVVVTSICAPLQLLVPPALLLVFFLSDR